MQLTAVITPPSDEMPALLDQLVYQENVVKLVAKTAWWISEQI